MKILYPNLANLMDTGPDESLSSFPVINILDDHLLKCWKAEAGAATQLELNFESLGAADTVAIFGLDFEAVTIKLYSDSAMTSFIEEKSFTCHSNDVFGTKKLEQIWWNLDEQSTLYEKLVVDTNSYKTPKIGMVAIGKSHSYPNPSWGFKQGFKDHSIRKGLKNGSSFTRNKVIARAPSASLQIPVLPAGKEKYYELLYLFKRVRSENFACLMVEGLTDDQGSTLDHEYAIWGSFAASFSPTEAKYSVFNIDFTIEEGL